MKHNKHIPHLIMQGVLALCIAAAPAAFAADATATATTAPSTNVAQAANARQVIERQLAKSGKGLFELTKFTLTDSMTQTSDNITASVVKYTGEVRLIQDAAVWTDNAPSVTTVYDLWHFEPVPDPKSFTPDTLKTSSSPGRIYQLWKKGTTFTFAGAAVLRKFDEGWRALDVNGDSDDPTAEPDINAQVSGEPKPDGYLIYHADASGAVVSTPSAVPGIELAAPDDATINADFAKAVGNYIEGTLKVASMKISDLQTDSLKSGGDHINCDMTVDCTLTLLKPVISYDGQIIHAIPAIGSQVPDNVTDSLTLVSNLAGQAVAERVAPYWDAGQTISLSFDFKYRRTKTDAQWGQPSINQLTNPSKPLKSDQTARIRYKTDASGNLNVSEVTVEKKVQ